MAKHSANIHASQYDGTFDVSFDCCGVKSCRFALCSMMPPDDSEPCTFNREGSCHSPSARRSALDSLRKRIATEIKRYEDEE